MLESEERATVACPLSGMLLRIWNMILKDSSDSVAGWGIYSAVVNLVPERSGLKRGNHVHTTFPARSVYCMYATQTSNLGVEVIFKAQQMFVRARQAGQKQSAMSRI